MGPFRIGDVLATKSKPWALRIQGRTVYAWTSPTVGSYSHEPRWTATAASMHKKPLSIVTFLLVWKTSRLYIWFGKVSAKYIFSRVKVDVEQNDVAVVVFRGCYFANEGSWLRHVTKRATTRPSSSAELGSWQILLLWETFLGVLSLD
jgi:hypothetical protein